MSTPNAYDRDFYAWTQEQAALLERRHLDALDLENLLEEVTCLGRSEKRTLGSHARNLLLHLLTWQYQPAMRQHSWHDSITEARYEMEDTLRESPSLRREVSSFVALQYPRARKKAHAATSLPLATFPETCPWTVTQLLEVDFFPET